VLNGQWDAYDAQLGKIVYKKNKYPFYLYVAEDPDDGNKRYWTVSTNPGKIVWSNGWCGPDEDDILKCSGNWIENTSPAAAGPTVISECGAAPAPTNANNGNQPTQPNNGNGGNNGQGKEEGGTIVDGLEDTYFYIIIIVLAIILCCVIVICIYICARNRKMKGQHSFQKGKGHADDWDTGIYK